MASPRVSPNPLSDNTSLNRTTVYHPPTGWLKTAGGSLLVSVLAGGYGVSQLDFSKGGSYALIATVALAAIAGGIVAYELHNTKLREIPSGDLAHVKNGFVPIESMTVTQRSYSPPAASTPIASQTDDLITKAVADVKTANEAYAQNKSTEDFKAVQDSFKGSSSDSLSELREQLAIREQHILGKQKAISVGILIKLGEALKPIAQRFGVTLTLGENDSLTTLNKTLNESIQAINGQVTAREKSQSNGSEIELQKMNNLQNQVIELETKLNQATNQYQTDMQECVDAQGREKAELQGKITTLEDQLTKFRAQQSESSQATASTVSAREEELQREIGSLTEQLSQAKKQNQLYLDSANAEKSGFQDQVKSLESQLMEAKQEIESIKQSSKNATKQVKIEFQEQVQSLQYQIESAQAELDRANTTAQDRMTEMTQNHQAEIVRYKTALDNARQEKETALEKAKNQIAKLKSEKKSLTNEMAELAADNLALIDESGGQDQQLKMAKQTHQKQMTALERKLQATNKEIKALQEKLQTQQTLHGSRDELNTEMHIATQAMAETLVGLESSIAGERITPLEYPTWVELDSPLYQLINGINDLIGNVNRQASGWVSAGSSSASRVRFSSPEKD